MIAEGVLAIEMAALAKDIALTIHPHPDAVGDGHGIGRSSFRHQHPRLSAQTLSLAEPRSILNAQRNQSSGACGFAFASRMPTH